MCRSVHAATRRLCTDALIAAGFTAEELEQLMTFEGEAMADDVTPDMVRRGSPRADALRKHTRIGFYPQHCHEVPVGLPDPSQPA